MNLIPIAQSVMFNNKVNSFNQNYSNTHKRFITTFAFLGGFLFILWGVVVELVENKGFEIWELRILIGVLLILTPILSRILNPPLILIEWYIALIGLLAASYAFIIGLRFELHPAWVAGTTVIILGFLSALTNLAPSLFFGLSCILVSLLSHSDVVFQTAMSPWIVQFNFLCAVLVGFYSSFEKNSHVRKIEESESQQSLILSNMTEGVFLQDREGKIIAANQRLAKILGLENQSASDPEQSVRSWILRDESNSTLPEEQFPSFVAIQKGQPLQGIALEYEKQNGNRIWIDITAVPIFSKVHVGLDSKSGAEGALVTVRDITEIRSAKEVISRQRESLLVSSKLSAIGELSSGIAHEINNPLAIVSTQVHVLKKGIESGSLDQQSTLSRVDKIIQTVERISKIIGSMKALSRLSDRDQLKPVNLKKVTDHILEICKHNLEDRKIRLSCEIKNDLTILAHEGQIGQILINLINNARDAITGTDSPWIEIKAHQVEDRAQIRVVDSGPGIPHAIRSKIMEPFFTTKEVGKGTGLGLSLVRTIVNHHQGRFFLDETSPKTTFVVEIPLSNIQSVNTKTVA